MAHFVRNNIQKRRQTQPWKLAIYQPNLHILKSGVWPIYSYKPTA